MWWERYKNYVRDHTADGPQPEVGQRYRSFADTVEILEVSPPMELNGKTDVAVRFKVVEVHSAEDSSMEHENVDIFWGDMIEGCAYTLVESLDIPDAGDDDSPPIMNPPDSTWAVNWVEILRKEQEKIAQRMRGSVPLTMAEHAGICALLSMCVDQFDPNVPQEKEVLDGIEKFRLAWNPE